MNYRVKSLSLNGKGRIFRSGDIVSEDNFKPGMFHKLVSAGHIAAEPSVEITPPTANDKNEFTVVVSTAVWKRYDVFKMFSQGIKTLQTEFKNIKFIVIVAGSEGDVSRQNVNEQGFQYIEISNDPLATKFNATTTAAQYYNPDYVLCLGSDDIIHPSLMREYIKCMQQGYDFIGIQDMYFWDTVSKKCLYWAGYRDSRRLGHSAGAGRLISRRLMNEWNWKPWENKHSKVLDNSMQEKLRTTKRSEKLINIKSIGAFALDIKSDVNMTPFLQWDNSEFISPNTIQQQFKYLPICAE